MSGNSLRMFFCLALVIGFVVGPTSAQAQVTCPGLTLSSQADINNLNITCEEIDYLEIVGSDIVDLKPLANLNLKRVNSILEIDDTMLKSLEGLESITFVGTWLGLYGNPELINLNGLSGLKNGGARIDIQVNDSLEDLQGLRNLGSAESFKIRFNPKLVNLDGLQGLEDVRDVEISNNNRLLSLKGLEGLRYVRQYNGIYDNPSLTSFCSLYPLFYEGSSVTPQIFGNAVDPTKDDIVAGGACLPDPTDYIGQLLNSGVINDGQLSALLTKLNKCNSNALTNQASAFVNAGIMTQEEADILVAATTASCL